MDGGIDRGEEDCDVEDDNNRVRAPVLVVPAVSYVVLTTPELELGVEGKSETPLEMRAALLLDSENPLH